MQNPELGFYISFCEDTLFPCMTWSRWKRLTRGGTFYTEFAYYRQSAAHAVPGLRQVSPAFCARLLQHQTE